MNRDLKKKNEIIDMQDKTIDALSRINRNAEETRGIASSTLEELRYQNNQIDNIGGELDNTTTKQETSKILINRFNVLSKPITSLFGMRENVSIKKDSSKLSDILSFIPDRSISKKNGVVYPVENNDLVYNPDNDEFLSQVNQRDRSINIEIDRTSDSIDDLLNMASMMKDEIRSQSGKIDCVSNKMENTVINQVSINRGLKKHI